MKFLGKIPTVWDETNIIKAKLGEYIVETRRSGDSWFLAAMNNWTPREFTIPLDFIGNEPYNAEIASDGINASRNPEDILLKKSIVTTKDSIKIKLAPGGGFVAVIHRN